MNFIGNKFYFFFHTRYNTSVIIPTVVKRHPKITKVKLDAEIGIALFTHPEQVVFEQIIVDKTASPSIGCRDDICIEDVSLYFPSEESVYKTSPLDNLLIVNEF